MRILILLFATLFSLSALAHHNYRLKFDDNREITLTGIVTKFDWKNPHIEIFMDVTGEDGRDHQLSLANGCARRGRSQRNIA